MEREGGGAERGEGRVRMGGRVWGGGADRGGRGRGLRTLPQSVRLP